MYLPIYMLFRLWYNISFFIENSGIVLDRIIFERIYCKKWVLYVNLTKKEEILLDNYLKAKLREDIFVLSEAGYILSMIQLFQNNDSLKHGQKKMVNCIIIQKHKKHFIKRYNNN